MEAKSDASAPVSQLDSAFTEIVISAITWLAEGSKDRKPIQVGRRKLAYLLIGSSNGTALKLQFFKCPYWGALSFLSVRKVERLILMLTQSDILFYEKSPRLRMNVLAIREQSEPITPSICSNFAEDTLLPLDDVDLALFERLSQRRQIISWYIGKKNRRGYPMVICRDRVLILLCIHKPNSISELKEIIPISDRLELEYLPQLMDVYLNNSPMKEKFNFSEKAMILQAHVDNEDILIIRHKKHKETISTKRKITPLAVYINPKRQEYLEAYDHAKEGKRTFRIDRISSIKQVEE